MAQSELSFPKRVGAGERVFLGFPEKQVRGALDWLETSVFRTERTCETLEQASLSPLRRVAKGKFTGGVHVRGSYCSELALKRGAAKVSIIVEPRLDSDVAETLPEAWYGGVIFDHYGHFVMEGLSRTGDDRIASSLLPIVFFNAPRLPALRGYMSDIFRHWGIDPSRVRLIDKPTMIERLRVLDPYISIRAFIDTSVRDWIASRPMLAGGSDGAIYLSRSRLKDRRRLLNEPELEARAAEGGVRVVHPQEHAFAEQVRLLTGARVVAGPEGSAFHTFIPAGGATTKIILCNGFPNLNYLLQDEIVDGDAVYVNGGKDAPPSQDLNVWTLDPDRMSGFLAEIAKRVG